jgi:hypothetical protein
LTAQRAVGSYLHQARESRVPNESEKEEQRQELEDRIEDLTKELSGLINAAGTKGRDELRDYAISLIQGETETGTMDEPPLGTNPSSSSAFNPLALSIPFFLIGCFLLLLFPPVGLLLLAFAVAMGVWGGVVVLFSRQR